MTHYQDITLAPDAETCANHLLSSVHSRLHIALAELESDNIGISFPGYSYKPERKRKELNTLGTALRLHGTAQALDHLMATEWLAHLREQVAMALPRPVPPGAGNLKVRRIQIRSSPARIRRRQMKRHGLTEAEALAIYPDGDGKTTDLPFLRLRSHSTANTFLLFINQSPTVENSLGKFNAYGLSDNATVPSFGS
ncbi:type I-F CRISPR-associated endoribonuclease Cas6/Csy4 [Luteolibacter algae]|uniref:Type I-F CRISPR-associated endoribonuclease Cas6/Csy4 n=1 Tax=Luteolibacter algae TaxID=454151 RepID=A0ABW5DE29_9BACT